MPYCEKHNKEKLLSKFLDPKTGEKQYWCPDCNREWKEKKAQEEQKKTDGGLIILDELQAFRKEFNERFDSLAKYLAEKLK